jgi:hypothetical protein
MPRHRHRRCPGKPRQKLGILVERSGLVATTCSLGNIFTFTADRRSLRYPHARKSRTLPWNKRHGRGLFPPSLAVNEKPQIMYGQEKPEIPTLSSGRGAAAMPCWPAKTEGQVAVSKSQWTSATPERYVSSLDETQEDRASQIHHRHRICSREPCTHTGAVKQATERAISDPVSLGSFCKNPNFDKKQFRGV